MFKTIGIGRSLLLLPSFAVTGYGLSAFLPALALVAVVKVVENSTDYSLQNTIQQALFLKTSRDAKYKAKAAIDTFLVRTGDLVSTGLVAVGAHIGLSVFGFAVSNVLFAVMWLAVVMRLARIHQQSSTAAVPAPVTVALGGRSPELVPEPIEVLPQ